MIPQASRLWWPPLGTFLLVPLEDGTFGYGRILPKPDMAFYNHRTTEASHDLDDIERQPVLFKQSVRLFDDDGWLALGARPLEGDVARPVVRFRQDIADYTRCYLYDTAGMKRMVTPQECVGIERAAVWDAPNIAERLLDTFMGRPNGEEIRSRVRFEDF